MTPGLGALPVLQIEDLRVWLHTKRGIGRAVDGVDLVLYSGETVGLVGESGSGKSLTALTVVGMNPTPASRVEGGRIVVLGEDLLAAPAERVRQLRGRTIAMIPQDPLAALNPVIPVGEQIAEAVRLTGSRGKATTSRTLELLRLVRISDPERRIHAYPHQLSGGMRQRVVSAIALASNPLILLADEPTTALDVTTQAAYLTLLREIQRTTNVAILMITHDFAVVSRVCDRVNVMYAGRIVESGPTKEILKSPRHPYTKALVGAVLDVDGTSGPTAIAGQPPNPFLPASGCAFEARCPVAMQRCREAFPTPTWLGKDHFVKCWREDGPR